MNDTSKDIKQLSITINSLTKQLRDTQTINSNRINDDKKISDKCEQQLKDDLNRLTTKLIEVRLLRILLFWKNPFSNNNNLIIIIMHKNNVLNYT